MYLDSCLDSCHWMCRLYFPHTNISVIIFRQWLMNMHDCHFYYFLHRNWNGTKICCISMYHSVSQHALPILYFWQSNSEWSWGWNHDGPQLLFLFMRPLRHISNVRILSHILKPGNSSLMTDGVIVDFKTSAFWFLGGTVGLGKGSRKAPPTVNLFYRNASSLCGYMIYKHSFISTFICHSTPEMESHNSPQSAKTVWLGILRVIQRFVII